MAVAVDHADVSLYKYVPAVIAAQALSDLRRSIIGAAIEGGADAIVVRSEDHHWTLAKYRNSRLILGLTDRTLEQIRISTNLLDSLRSAQLIKCGVHLSDGDLNEVTIFSAMSRFINLHNTSARWIIEPYFTPMIRSRQRGEFIRWISKINQVCAFKLDLDVENAEFERYSEATGRKPWYARSDGKNFDVFAEKFQKAVDRGCYGAVVGAAIWKETALLSEGKTIPDVCLVQIRERIATLKKLTDQRNTL